LSGCNGTRPSPFRVMRQSYFFTHGLRRRL
jgi:hypothetical protein